MVATQTIPFIVASCKSHGLQIHSPALLEFFFSVAKENLTSSLKIPGSNSPPVIIDAAAVEATKSTFGQIERYIQSINGCGTQAQKVDGWRKLFGESFPTRI